MAEAKRNARNQAVDPAVFEGESLRSGAHAIPSPREVLRIALFDRLGQWAPIKQHISAGNPASQFARTRALAALDLLDDALAQLGNRKGARAETTRAALAAQRATIAAALAAFDSIGATLDGPVAQDFIARITASRAALAEAFAAKEVSTRETVEAASLEIERCLSDARALDRDISTLVQSLALPEFPSKASFEIAERTTADLERQPKKPSIRAIAGAIDAGLSTPDSIASLFVIYESDPPHELVAWRARAMAEK